MNGQIEWEYEHGRVKEYAVEILTLGLCDLFFREQFISERDYLIGSCQTEGYLCLASFRHLKTDEILQIMTGLLHGVYQAEKHYLFAEEFQLSQELIFVAPDFSRLKVLFVPDFEGISLKRKLMRLLTEFREKSTSQAAGYIENALDFMEQDEYGYKSILHHFENLRREVYLCGVE